MVSGDTSVVFYIPSVAFTAYRFVSLQTADLVWSGRMFVKPGRVGYYPTTTLPAVHDDRVLAAQLGYLFNRR